MPKLAKKPATKSTSRKSNKNLARNQSGEIKVPPASDWRTSDEDEILKRRLRAREEHFVIKNLHPAESIFSNFQILSESGMTYCAEIRDLAARQFSCTCTDFRINGLGTCKHIEALLLHLEVNQRRAWKDALKNGSARVDIIPDRAMQTLRIERNLGRLPKRYRKFFDKLGIGLPEISPEEILEGLRNSGDESLRISQDVAPWLEMRARERERIAARRDYEVGVQEGRYPEHVTMSPLFPYQREGMLHLAFKERAMLADEMGLGKTIQAIAACALLHHLGKARRVLVVTPASLKTEWEEQIQKFTTLPLRLVFGSRSVRAGLYKAPEPPFFTIANYEQIVADSLEINEFLRPDVVVLDEAQRIKNWATKTAQSVKRLQSRYAFVLTGTPLENRIDELRSLVDFLDPSILGPLFRFNRDFYTFDERGRPKEYKNLELLRDRVRPVLLRRRKAEVETELPDRADRTHFVALTPKMRSEYASYEKQVAELIYTSQRRPLTLKEQDLLMILLNIMRMICDCPAIVKGKTIKDCPKVEELGRVLEELLSDDDVKVIIFSEWTGMLELVREWALRNRVGYAWHTGSVPQQRRRAEILGFRRDPNCRLFLSTDSGGVGLNLQNASVVINCDLPWNPAKLEQRIARAWRKGQTRPVTVINLVAENTIEHGMLSSLAHKTKLADGVLDGGETEGIQLKGGGRSVLKRLEQILLNTPAAKPAPVAPPSDPSAAFALRLREILGERLVKCDEVWAGNSDTPVLFAILHNGATEYRPRIEEVYKSIPHAAGLAPLQVLDKSAYDSLQALAEAGIITINTRATRPLLPAEGKPPLTAEELAEVNRLRETAAKKRKAAAALDAAGLPDEAANFVSAAEDAERMADDILSQKNRPPSVADA